jgi:hypothetical protein
MPSYPVIPDIPKGTLSGTISTALLPAGAVTITGTSGDVAHTAAVATLAAAVNKLTYLAGFSVYATGATNATVVDVTVADGAWTLTFPINVPASSAAVQLMPIARTFNPPLVASAPNTAIVVTCPTLGTGNTNCCVNVEGYQL